MDSDQESVGAVVGKLVAVAFESFMLALPHAEAFVGLGTPIFQVVNDNFVARMVTTDTLQKDLAVAIVHFGMSHASLGVHVPGECGGLHSLFLPGNRVELGEN